MAIINKINRGLKKIITYGLVAGFMFGNGCATTQKVIKEDKKNYEIYLQYFKEGKPEVKQFPVSETLNLDGIVTGIIINNADSANITTKKYIYPFEKVSIDTTFDKMNIMINDGNSAFSILYRDTSLKPIENKINKNTLTCGHFTNWHGLPFSTEDFNIELLNGKKVHIDQTNPEKIKDYKNILYLGNNKEEFEKQNKSVLEELSKSYKKLSKFKNNIKSTVIYKNDVNNACQYDDKVWLFTKNFEENGIEGIFEHEFLHNVVGNYNLPENEKIVNYFLELSAKINDEDLKQAYKTYKRMMISNKGWIVFGGLQNTGENKEFFDFISESSYIDKSNGGHPYSNSNEFVTSYIHSLFYPELISKKLKDSTLKINKLYFETGNLIIDNLKKGNYRNFIKNQLEYIKSLN